MLLKSVFSKALPRTRKMHRKMGSGLESCIKGGKRSRACTTRCNVMAPDCQGRRLGGDNVESQLYSSPHLSLLPQFLDAQRKTWEDRITAERLGIIEYFHRLAGTVHIGAFVYRVNQPTQQRTVVEIFLHFLKEIWQSIR